MMEAAYDRRRYDQHHPTRPPPPNPSSSSFYPRLPQQAPAPPTVNRAALPPVPGAPPQSSGLGIKVALKPQYRMAPPVQLSPVIGEVPRTSIAQFDFDFERKVIDDAERGVRTQIRQHQLANGGETASASQANDDPVISKYLSMGLSREAVSLGVAAYGDVQAKVVEFCSAYSLLREMGFPSTAVAGALVMHDNDKEKALAQFV
ncbi:protein HUA2-LIKE 1-like [Selaginella moellendorffii]|uniref:protein HUA2-LIKE 1-like n=1 Tax=Selaginella moellendorffii TaxID=88036 RepID=UPI000D1CE7E7|nr:protein HUA2-LIKE 1-like [Selaginella moellendorffii]|eukprot:XP_024518641.1 protein HUA2-LIKE 1-like [Selaginella moellendorffii]